jgi:hypothetical protein
VVSKICGNRLAHEKNQVYELCDCVRADSYTAPAWPAYAWVAAALVLLLVALMTIQGLGFLTPVNVLVCLELQKSDPDLNKIGVWMQRYFYVVALQGMMQVAIIVVMTDALSHGCLSRAVTDGAWSWLKAWAMKIARHTLRTAPRPALT